MKHNNKFREHATKWMFMKQIVPTFIPMKHIHRNSRAYQVQEPLSPEPLSRYNSSKPSDLTLTPQQIAFPEI